jgi:hypothetical protein
MLKATTLRINKKVYDDINKRAKEEYIDTSSFLRKLVMKAYKEYKLDEDLKDWSKGRKSIGEVAKNNNISIWQAIDEIKKRNLSSPISQEDVLEDLDFKI